MNKSSIRNSTLKYFPGATCKLNPVSGLYCIYFNIQKIGIGTTPNKAWEDAYQSRPKEGPLK